MTQALNESESMRDGLPRSSFAYAPTERPTDWKLPYLNASGAPDPAHLPGAAAALTEGGFRGERVSIPGEAVPAVKAKLRQAYRRWGKSDGEMPESIRETGADVDMMNAVVMMLEAQDRDLDAVLDARLAGVVALDAVLDARLDIREKDSDDHFYGAWSGGAKAQGGGPLAAGETGSHKNGTMGRYSKDGGRTWTPEREKLHDAYIDGAMAGVPTSDNPTLFMTGGGPASGKTAVILENPNAAFPNRQQAAHINPDDAKAALPEYQAGTKANNKAASSNVHEESSVMAKVGVARALGAGHDVVLDTVGDTGIAKLTAKVNLARAQGAKVVNADYATVSLATAFARSDARGVRTGRFVPHDEIARAHRDVSRTFEAAGKTNLFDRLRLWDNNGEHSPFLVAEGDGRGGFVIHDQRAWTSFLGIADD